MESGILQHMLKRWLLYYRYGRRVIFWKNAHFKLSSSKSDLIMQLQLPPACHTDSSSLHSCTACTRTATGNQWVFGQLHFLSEVFFIYLIKVVAKSAQGLLWYWPCMYVFVTCSHTLILWFHILVRAISDLSLKFKQIRTLQGRIVRDMGPNPALDTKYVPSIMYHVSCIMHYVSCLIHGLVGWVWG